MSKILDAINSAGNGWKHPSVLAYLETGDPRHLQTTPITPGYDMPLGKCLADPEAWDVESGRLLRIATYHSRDGICREWFERLLERDVVDWSRFAKASSILLECSDGDQKLLRAAVARFPMWDEQKNNPTLAGSLMLEASDAEMALHNREWHSGIPLLLAHACPERVAGIMSCLKVYEQAELWTALVRHDVGRFHLVAAAFACAQKPDQCIRLMVTLVGAMPSYRELAIQTAEAVLDSSVGLGTQVEACELLLALKAPDTLSRVITLLSDKLLPSNAAGSQAMNLTNGRFFECAINAFPDHVADICESATHSPLMEVAHMSIKTWRANDQAREDSRYFHALLRLLGHSSVPVVLLAIDFAVEHDAVAVHKHLWPLVDYSEAQVASTAARTLARMGNATLPDIVSILESEGTKRRVAIVSVVEAIATEEALALLWKQWDLEQDDEVIDRLLSALERRTGVIKLTTAQIAERVAKTLPRITSKPVPWLDPTAVELFREDGSKLTQDELRYLCHRQSHCQEMRADPEAAPLYERMDRSRNSTVALAAVEGFLNSKQKIVDRWVLAWAALIGDDSLVPVFTQAIKRWVDIHRNRHAECAGVALALIGSNRALSGLDSVSMNYRAKKPNVALAAAETFARIADERGVSVEKLGDLIIPLHGFNPEGFQIITGTKSSFKVTIGQSLSLSFRDMKTGKTSATIPSSLSAETKAKMKELAKAVKETFKAQTERLEALMVRQVRWSVSTWTMLYPAPPLLRPLSSRLVWGAYDATNILRHAFRILADGSLCDLNDLPVALDGVCQIGLLHPLELAEDQRQAWLQHLIDYDVSQPFQQLARLFSLPERDEQPRRKGARFEKVALGALTFRGRALRVGWRRASVGDGGMIGHYVKRMPESQVDAWLEIDGLYFGAGPDDQVELGEFFFLPSSSATETACQYAMPSSEHDERLIAFGNVPAIAYSEVIADLIKISGKGAESETTSE